MDGLETDAAGLQGGTVANVGDNFVVDAWLANWDVVGLGYDNLKVLQGRAVHIDTGAGLLYRAQGQPKASLFGDTVAEIESLRDAGLNPQAAATFKHVTQAQMIAGARKVLAVDAKTIEALVDQFGPGDAAAKQLMIKRLLARQNDIAKRFAEAVKKPKPVPVPPSARVSEQELTDIQEARVNGVALATDKDQIEDQNVLLWHKRDQQGQSVTGAVLKVRDKAAAAINALVDQSSGAPVKLADLSNTGTLIKELIIGVNAQANKGLELRAKDMSRLSAVRERLDPLLPTLKAAASDTGATEAMRAKANAAHQYLGSWQKAIEKAIGGLKTGDQAKTIGSEFFEPGKLPTVITKPQAKDDKAAFQWTKTGNNYTLADFDKSRQSDNDKNYDLYGSHFVTEVDDALVRYYPDKSGTPFALRGRLQIEVKGQDTAAAAKHFAVLDKLGVDASRASAADQEAMYLQRIAYRYQVDEQMNAYANTPAERRAWLEQKLNTQLAGGALYRPQGQLQAFEHGRRSQLDPVLQAEKGWQSFSEDYVLHHRLYNGLLKDLPRILAGGGQMAPSTDKMRRGVPFGGMSPEEDLRTGGASYFFTRLLSRQAANSTGVGLKWKAKHVARLDAVSYNHDAFGKTHDGYVQAHNQHGKGLGALKKTAKNGGNEMIFKDSLSLFDDLDHIKAGKDRKAVIQIFKDHGYEKWPDGRALEEVIRR
jgi:hypothetical protein